MENIPEHNVKLAFWVSGGIGDYFIAARFIRDLFAVTGDVPFHIFGSKTAIANWVFGSFSAYVGSFSEELAIPRNLNRYGAVYRLTTFIDCLLSPSSKAALPEDVSKHVKRTYQAMSLFNPKIAFQIQNHPRLDGYLGEIMGRHGFTRMTLQQGIAGIPYGGDAMSVRTDKNALVKFDLSDRPYITVHNGYDTEFKVGSKILQGTSTKNYPHFQSVITHLRQTHPDLWIVQMGSRTSTPIKGTDLNLIDKTNLEECAEILRHSQLHIDGESGLVHIAACLGVKSCVIFGPTSVDFFGYAQNINIAPPVCGNCWHMTEDWLAQCPRGLKEAQCLSEQNPQLIADIVSDALAQPYPIAVRASA